MGKTTGTRAGSRFSVPRYQRYPRLRKLPNEANSPSPCSSPIRRARESRVGRDGKITKRTHALGAPVSSLRFKVQSWLHHDAETKITKRSHCVQRARSRFGVQGSKFAGIAKRTHGEPQSHERHEELRILPNEAIPYLCVLCVFVVHPQNYETNPIGARPPACSHIMLAILCSPVNQ
jgi:hypothetical protein